MKQAKILLIGCSFRSAGELSPKQGANTDIGLYHAQEGAKDYTKKIEYARLLDYFDGLNAPQKNIEELLKKIKEADGLVVGMPVYYGYYPSLLQALYWEIEKRRINLFPKIVGFLCAGAKRGGGQTNAIIFAAWDIMKFGAAVVNEGAPLGQFGGNIMAGDKNTAPEDSEGMGSCFLIGRRVAEISRILLIGNTKEKVYIHTWDTDKLVKDYKIMRCVACDECPNLTVKWETGDYGCILRDRLEELHPQLVQAEGVVLKGINKIFIERMRYMRRDNYRFNHSVFQITQLPQISVSVKYTAVLCRKNLKQYTALYKSGQKISPPKPQIYIPAGYRLKEKLG